MKGNFFISEKKVKNQNKFEFILVKRILPILVIGLGIFLIVDGGNYFNYQNEFIKSILSQMTGFIISFFGLFLISNEISLKGVYKIISYIFMLLFITFIIYTVKNLFLQE